MPIKMDHPPTPAKVSGMNRMRRLGILGGLIVLLTLSRSVAAVFMESQAPAEEPLPARIVNIQYLPPVASQPSQPACVAWAFCYYYKTWQDAREQGWIRPNPATHPERVCNPEFVWRLGDVTNVLKYLGCASFAAMPALWDVTHDQPTDACFADARLHRASAFRSLPADPDEAFAALRAHLAGGNLANTSMSFYSNFSAYQGGTGEGYESDVYFAAGGSSGGGHSMTIIGYDDAKTYNKGGAIGTGAFLLVNSWGTNWGCMIPEAGTKGFIWIGYDYFRSSGMLNSVTIMEDRPSTEDRNFVQFQIAHPQMAELVCSFRAGDPDFPTGVFNIGNLIGTRSYYGTIRVGIDDLLKELAYGFRLTVFDMNLSGSSNLDASGTGVVEDWHLELNGIPQPWFCQELPLATVDWNNLVDPEEGKLKTSIFEMSLLEEKYVDASMGWGGADQHWQTSFDMEGDGDLDLLSVYPFGIGRFYYDIMRNNGDGEFERIRCNIAPEARVMDTGDFNRDHRLDVLVANPVTKAFELYLAEGRTGEYAAGHAFPAFDDTVLASARAIDFDLDGNLDVVTLCGNEAPGPFSPSLWRLWLNNGAGNFTDSGLRLPYPSKNDDKMAVGDFNGDGWPDLALASVKVHASGEITYPVYELMLLAHTGPSMSFAEVAAFACSGPEFLSWSDMDGDGRLDLFVSDSSGLRILKNIDGSTFAFIDHNLNGIKNVASMAFGDVNADGRMDLAIQAKRPVAGKDKTHTAVYLNVAPGEYTWLAGPRDPFDLAAVNLGDFDADGDLDFLVQGEYFDGERPPVSQIRYFNGKSANADRLNRPNAVPQRPVVTTAGIDVSMGGIVFDWNGAEDDHTLADSMTYRVRVGSLPGWDNIVGHPLHRTVQAAWRPRASSSSAPSHRGLLRVLPARPVFLSVQAMDQGLAVSEWSEPVEIRPQGESSAFDLNGDGRADIADIVMFINQSDKIPVWLKGDLNGNGKLDSLDLTAAVNRLLGRDGPPANALGIVKATSQGGEFVSPEFSVRFPPQTVSNEYSITILPSDERFEGATQLPGTVFQLDGMPAERNGPILIEMPAPDGISTASVLLAVAQESYPASTWKRSLVWRSFRPIRANGRLLTFEVPAPMVNLDRLLGEGSPLVESAAAQVQSSAIRPLGLELQSTGTNQYSLSIVTNIFGLVTGQLDMESEHFRVRYPDSMESPKIAAMLNALEWTYAQWRDVYHMNYAAYMSWPAKVPVEVRDMKLDGFYCPVFDFIALRKQNVDAGTLPYEKDLFTAACAHEFTHMALSRHAHGIKPVGFAYKTLWPEEATATYMESVYTQGGTPSVMDQNLTQPFQEGMVKGAARDPQNYGYGMASLMAWFDANDPAHAFPMSLWSQINKNFPVPNAFSIAGGQPNLNWWTRYLEDLVTGKHFPFGFQDVDRALKLGNTFDFKTLTADDWTWSRAKKFRAPRIEDLSACLYKLIPDPVRMQPNMTLSLRLTRVNPSNSSNIDLSLFKKHINEITLLDRGVPANDGLKCDLPVSSILGNLNELLAMASAPEMHLSSYDPQGATPPGGSTYHPGYTDVLLMAGITEDRRWDLPADNYSENGGEGNFAPQFRSTYSVEGRGLANVMFEDNTPYDGYYFVAYSLGLPPIEYKIAISAVCLKNRSSNTNVGTVYSAGPIKTYRMSYKLNSPDDGLASTDSVDGQFMLPLSLTSKYLYADLYAVYDVTEEVYDGQGGLMSSTTHSNRMTKLSRLTIVP